MNKKEIFFGILIFILGYTLLLSPVLNFFEPKIAFGTVLIGIAIISFSSTFFITDGFRR